MNERYNYNVGDRVIIIGRNDSNRFPIGSTQIVQELHGGVLRYVGLLDERDSRGYWNVRLDAIRIESECYQCKHACKMREKCPLYEGKEK